MIKLAAMLVFVAVGAAIGSLFYKLIGHQKLTLPVCVGLGVLGAFAGMLLGDLADIRLVGNMIDGLLFSSVGSVLILGLNLLLRPQNKR